MAKAQEITRLHKRIHETVRYLHKSKEQTESWETACKEFHARYDMLAFPGGYSTAIPRIRANDPAALEAAICFVECRPYFFRSGYMYKELLQKLKRADLSPQQADRFERVLIACEAWKAAKRAAPKT